VKFIRSFIVLLPLLLGLGCDHLPEISWEQAQISAHDLYICQGRVCPDLTIAYPNFISNDTILIKRLNTIRDSLIVDALYLGSDRPNFDLNIEQSMNQYLWVSLDYKPQLEMAESYNGQIKVIAHWHNDHLLALQVSGRLLLPAGDKLIQNTRRISLKPQR
jgi:hypothetical protein